MLNAITSTPSGAEVKHVHGKISRSTAHTMREGGGGSKKPKTHTFD